MVKVLSDFDGVWTDQRAEARCVVDHFVARAAELAGVAADEAQADFDGLARALARAPAAHGWAPGEELSPGAGGVLTAFVDEDPLLLASALGRALGLDDAPQELRRYMRAILGAGFPSLSAFTNRCFLEATERFRSRAHELVVPRALEAFEALRAAGAELVIVSNSSTEKIAGLLGPLGLPVGGALRVRGHAAKFALGPSDRHELLGGRRVALDRPRYLRALEEEQPDVVIGDVYSLDLALPLWLRRQRHAAAPGTLVLHRHVHTPDWVLAQVRPGAVDHAVDHLEQLAVIVRQLVAGPRRVNA